MSNEDWPACDDDCGRQACDWAAPEKIFYVWVTQMTQFMSHKLEVGVAQMMSSALVQHKFIRHPRVPYKICVTQHKHKNNWFNGFVK